MKLLTIFLIFVISVSCSNYVARMYKELDEDDKTKNPNKYDQFDIYRRPMVKDSSAVSSKNYQQINPAVKRQYVPPEETRKRYTANDLIDNEQNGSLWAEADSSNSLYAGENIHRPGDIIKINVMGKLKNDIGQELNRIYSMSPSAPESAANNATNPIPPETTNPEPAAATNDQQVYDNISGIITEEISASHFLIRGRKHLIYKNQKKLIEIQALVSKKDITQDIISSDRFLETTIHVLR